MFSDPLHIIDGYGCATRNGTKHHGPVVNDTLSHDEACRYSSSRRTLHIGIDLGGPVGTKVFSFWDGKIYKFGYNEALGDYGYVVIVEYSLPTQSLRYDKTNNSNVDDRSTTTGTKVWALYGHLDRNSVKGKRVGQKVRKGGIIGRIGDVHENGGWCVSCHQLPVLSCCLRFMYACWLLLEFF